MCPQKTPGVYIEEISTLPPSVAEVSTAIPAFIGYTEKGPKSARINTLLEFESLFGKAKPSAFKATAAVDPATGLRAVTSLEPAESAQRQPEFLLYYCVSHYFKNGGGSCYIFSIGNYDATLSKDHFLAGLAALEKEDEPTLILLTDAVHLSSSDYYREVCAAALAQCEKLKDRFVILDVKDGDVEAFRAGIGTNSLMYAAAYHPYLRTTLDTAYREADIEIEGVDASALATAAAWAGSFGDDGIDVSFLGSEGATPGVQIVKGSASDAVEIAVDAGERKLTLRNVDGEDGTSVAAAWSQWEAAGGDAAGFAVSAAGDGSGAVRTTGNATEDLAAQSTGSGGAGNTLGALKDSETSLYNQIKAAMGEQHVVLPPSSAMAGVYARVDRNRGVWKAPANVSLSAVIGPVSKISHEEQELLNVDPTAGKSINAIRDFTGKGTLVWGARTLAGNDNEWRYVSVRRLFIMIEESTQKATAFAVFEPNDATTWLKVKGMIESYLYGLWERGALAGPTPEAAYFVNVGLGKTMTPQDILEGRMIVEIGVAAVRPAEFIVIRFMHKLQEA